MLADPGDLYLFHAPADLLDDDGDVDPYKVLDAAQELIHTRPGFATPSEPVRTFGQGRRPVPPREDANWQGVLRGW